MKNCLAMLILGLGLISAGHAQTTVGLISHTKTSYDSGYILFAPMSGNTTYLIDKCGKLIHSWGSRYNPGLSCYLLEDGTLLRAGSLYNDLGFTAGGRGGIIEKIGPNSEVMWSYRIADSTQCQHHDITMLPNGDILAIVWEIKTPAEAIDAGRDSSKIDKELWSEKIVEIRPMMPDGGEIVWEWHVWDHLVQGKFPSKANYGKVSDHPELIDINYLGGTAAKNDWLHINGIDYNPDLDQIMISVHEWSEIWIIDHGTTTAEARSHTGGKRGKGGDLLYRWGNPNAYGTSGEQQLFMQHNPHWIAKGLPNAGKILVFNNGMGRPASEYSTVEIFAPPVDKDGNYDTKVLPYLPLKSDWIYKDPTPAKFYAPFISGAQVLKNGNVLVCSGPQGRFFEIDKLKKKCWEYVNPVDNSGPVAQGATPKVNSVFRCTFYPYGYQGLQLYSLDPGEPVEKNPSSYACQLNLRQTQGNDIADAFEDDGNIMIYPNPASDVFRISGLQGDSRIIMYNSLGDKVLECGNCPSLNTSSLASGLYSISIESGAKVYTQKLLIRH